MTAAVYTDWYFRLGTLCERNSMRMRPLDGQEARALEISAAMFASRLQTRGRPQSGPVPDTGSQGSGGDTTPRSRVVLS